ncbi:hypothetical protein MANES_17G005350v8 [Manihot esculenta]|uniref:Uncharacterized protein n=1 Tax=Manihot esculenta TaxID=3983 RepID=A0ACB7G2P9_MANES|nr:hypothetical protein MANES_17G005350v8 [Manihot esculenta]
MLRKSVVMPKTAMALTIGASILGQVIGSRAERHRLKAVAERNSIAAETAIVAAVAATGYSTTQVSCSAGGQCGKEGMTWDPLYIKAA